MRKPAPGRRQFLGGLLAAGLLPKPTWADAGSPTYLSAAARPDGRYVLCGISEALDVRFQIPLPARGHAAAAHPSRPEAVAFARRPGTFAIVIDCATGRTLQTLTTPEGRHFYGHGAYSTDGTLLFTTENDFEAGVGRIGVWDVTRDYMRVDEWDSGGIGPHDIKRLPGSDTLVVANGGIDTHPDSGRTKLNIPTMRPNLSYIAQGRVIETAALPPEMRKNSIRHLAVNARGDIALGMQWQGDGPVRALVGLHRRGAQIVLMGASGEEIQAMNGYVGSIAFSKDGRTIAVTSPRGGRLHVYDAELARLDHVTPLEDVCGVAPHVDGFTLTSGTGNLRNLKGPEVLHSAHSMLRWDNHLISI
ncbi:DUF1513 domain-containing protein [uncultured Roseobacter sp.]|uniref:DUF1513 domain-containing protein n=1 Tax=uncultured Roseobacter sp. TaxID=114847 RepID=UPI0026380DF3|nr:DUF1513 domain-containing protein [uncultured Roseobacter sp.]